jgi:hypothetical protein
MKPIVECLQLYVLWDILYVEKTYLIILKVIIYVLWDTLYVEKTYLIILKVSINKEVD